MSAASLTTLPVDLYPLLFKPLTVKTLCNISYVCKALHIICASETCQMLWEAACKKNGIEACLPGKTWQQSFGQAMASLTFTREYMDTRPPMAESHVRQKVHQMNDEVWEIFPKLNIIDIDEKKCMLTWEDEASIRELFLIDRLPTCKLRDCALSGDLLALNFGSKELVNTRLQVWNLSTERKVLDRTLHFPTMDTQISSAHISLTAIIEDHKGNVLHDFKPLGKYVVFHIKKTPPAIPPAQS